MFPMDTFNNKAIIFHQNVLLAAPNFPSPNQPRSLQLYYSIVDPNLGSKGTLIEKNKLILNDTLENANVLPVRHANGRDWWVVVKRFKVDLFYSCYSRFCLFTN